ncbi:hypothetical protein RSOL_195300, partial [Rhizoctonia solani AG-3 Rhs1AP]
MLRFYCIPGSIVYYYFSFKVLIRICDVLDPRFLVEHGMYGIKGSAGSTGGLQQTVPLVLYFVKLNILGRPLRSKVRTAQWDTGNAAPFDDADHVFNLGLPSRKASMTLAILGLGSSHTKLNGQPLITEQQAKLHEIGRGRTQHELHAKNTPRKAKKYGDSIAKEGKGNDGPESVKHPDAIEPGVWLPMDPLGVAVAKKMGNAELIGPPLG